MIMKILIICTMFEVEPFTRISEIFQVRNVIEGIKIF